MNQVGLSKNLIAKKVAFCVDAGVLTLLFAKNSPYDRQRLLGEAEVDCIRKLLSPLREEDSSLLAQERGIAERRAAVVQAIRSLETILGHPKASDLNDEDDESLAAAPDASPAPRVDADEIDDYGAAEVAHRPSGRAAIRRIMSERPRHLWTAREIYDVMLRRGWTSAAENQLRIVETALVALLNKGELERPARGRYRCRGEMPLEN